MTLPGDPPLQKLQFYVTTPYRCGYLENKAAQSLIATPQYLVDAKTYDSLIGMGFRRSGKFVYRPHCESCNACIPVRLPVADAQPNRSQKRAYKQHQHLSVSVLPLEFHQDHFKLYCDYQVARHDGSHERETEEQYRSFLIQSNVESRLVEFRENGILKMISVVDFIRDGISAVYTFYETSDKTSSYGTFNIMWLSAWCKELGLPYLYLGYWIAASQKMAYKEKFKPLQALIDGHWQNLSK